MQVCIKTKAFFYEVCVCVCLYDIIVDKWMKMEKHSGLLQTKKNFMVENEFYIYRAMSKEISQSFVPIIIFSILSFIYILRKISSGQWPTTTTTFIGFHAIVRQSVTVMFENRNIFTFFSKLLCRSPILHEISNHSARPFLYIFFFFLIVNLWLFHPCWIDILVSLVGVCISVMHQLHL